MPIQVTCPECHRHIGLPDKYAGRRVKCPYCEVGRINVPATGASAPPGRPPDPPPQRPAAPPPPPASGAQPDGRLPGTAQRPAPAPPPPPRRPAPPPPGASVGRESRIQSWMRIAGRGDATVKAQGKSNKDVCEDAKEDLYRRIVAKRDELGLRFRVDKGEVYEYWIELTFSEGVGEEFLHQRMIRITMDETTRKHTVHFVSNARPVMPWVGVRRITDDDILACIDFLVTLKKPKRRKEKKGGLLERLAKLLLGLFLGVGGLVLVGVGIAASFAALPYSLLLLPVVIALAIVARLMARTYTIERPRPQRVVKRYSPMDYQNVLVPGLGAQERAVKDRLLRDLRARRLPDTTVEFEDVTQWGGYRLEESREWIVVSSRRAVVLVGVFAYSDDLFVCWDAYVNQSFWAKRRVEVQRPVDKLAEATGSWLRALGSRVEVYDYDETLTPPTEYDFSDVSAVFIAVKKTVEDALDELCKEHHIEKERLEIAGGSGQRFGPGSAAAAEAESGAAPKKGLAKMLGLARRKK